MGFFSFIKRGISIQLLYFHFYILPTSPYGFSPMRSSLHESCCNFSMVCNIAICGHTHKPFVQRDEWTNTLVMNPGSPTYPRGREGATMGRIIVDEETAQVVSAEIISLSSLEVLSSCK